MKTYTLTILILLSTSFQAFSYDFIENGIAYNILKDSTLSVTHKQKEENKWTNTDHSLTYTGDIVIPASVKHNGRKYKVTEIGNCAFYDCKDLTSIIISEGIKRLRGFSIAYCYRISSINIPASVSKIYYGFIFDCRSLSTITVSAGNKYFTAEANCLYNKKMTTLILVSPTLKEYKFPPSVKDVADYAFNASTITRLIIPDTVNRIGGRSFLGIRIGDIICNKKLEFLPGSHQFVPGMDLPPWATGFMTYSQFMHHN